MTKEIVSVYEGEKMTVTYDRRRCIHAAECGPGRDITLRGINEQKVPVTRNSAALS